MDKHHGNPNSFDRSPGRCIFHVKAKPQTREEKSNVDSRSKECGPQPRSRVKLTPEAGVCGLPKTSKRALGHHRAKTGLLWESLYQLCATHGFAKAVYAAWVIRSIKPVHPEMDIIGLLQSVGRQPATNSMRARIGKEDCIILTQKPFSEAVHPHAII